MTHIRYGSHAVHTPRQKIGVRGIDSQEAFDVLLHYDRNPGDKTPQFCDRLYMAGVAADNAGDVDKTQEFWRKLLQRDPGYLPERRGFGPRYFSDEPDPCADIKQSFKSRHGRQDWDDTVARFKSLQRQIRGTGNHANGA